MTLRFISGQKLGQFLLIKLLKYDSVVDLFSYMTGHKRVCNSYFGFKILIFVSLFVLLLN